MTQDNSYFKRAADAVAALESCSGDVETAAAAIAKAAEGGRLVHVFGLDACSADIEGEIFFRAGGLACVDPLYDPAFSNSHGGYRSELCRVLDGLAPRVLDYYERIEPGDPLLLLALDENSLAFAQAAGWSREHGLTTIAVIPERPLDGATNGNIDLAVCFGRGGGLESVRMTAVLGAVAERAVRLAPKADVWTGDIFPDPEKDRETIDKYLWRVRHL